MGVIFAKTPRGQDELTSKTGGLTPRQRRVLIFVDGKRSVEELRGMLQSDDLQHTLGLLEEAGYIELAGILTEAANQPAQPAPDALPSITAFRELSPTPDPLQLQQARNFMANTLNAFVGALGTSSLLERIDKAKSHDELRGHFDEWFHALVMSREGKREAEALRTKLLQVI